MEVQYQRTFSDYQETVAVRRIRSLDRKVVFVLAFCLIYILGMIVLMSFGLSQALASVAIIGGTILLGSVWSAVFHVWLKHDFRRHPNLALPESVRIDDIGLHAESEEPTGTTKWQAYSKFRETQNLFLLYLGPRLVQALPKRAFSVEQLEQFRRLVGTKLEGRG